MAYRVFLYKSEGATKDAPCIFSVNSALRHGQRQLPSDHFLLDSDCTAIMDQLWTEITEKNLPKDACRISEFEAGTKENHAHCILAVLSYDYAHLFLPVLSKCAAENDLVMYDTVTQNVFYRDIVDMTAIRLRQAQQKFHQAILRDLKPLCYIRRLYYDACRQWKECAYVITINKDPDKPFLQRVNELYMCLQSHLSEGETLECEDGCFRISLDYSTIIYCLEGYKKRSDKRGYMDHGYPQEELTHRMSCEDAFRSLRTLSARERRDAFRRQCFLEMKEKYPNPADRFVASVNISRQQLRYPYDIHYSGFGGYWCEIGIHVFPGEFGYHPSQVSMLKIGIGESKWFLPFLEKFYPYFGKRYYDCNHIPCEMMADIVKEMKEIRTLILRDPSSPRVMPYIQKISLSVIDEKINCRLMSDPERLEFIVQHRFQAAQVLESFIRWIDAQLETYMGEHAMFNIEGP